MLTSWKANTVLSLFAFGFSTGLLRGDTEIPSGTILQPGRVIEAGNTTLQMTGSGSLVVAVKVGGGSTCVWHAPEKPEEGSVAKIQEDGNFVIYHHSNVLWSSKTSGNPNAVVVVQNDGNVVCYDSKHSRALWATNTDRAESKPVRAFLRKGNMEYKVTVSRTGKVVAERYSELKGRGTGSVHYHFTFLLADENENVLHASEVQTLTMGYVADGTFRSKRETAVFDVPPDIVGKVWSVDFVLKETKPGTDILEQMEKGVEILRRINKSYKEVKEMEIFKDAIKVFTQTAS